MPSSNVVATGLAAPRWPVFRLKDEDEIAKVAMFSLVIIVSLLTSFHVSITESLTDLFQEGEYLAPRLFFEHGGHIRPLLIHGHINYIPSEIAAASCGVDRLVACTRAVNASFTAMAAFCFAGCALTLGRSRESRLFTGFGALLILLLINGRLSGNVELNQGSPSIREVWLLAELWCFLAVAEGHKKISIFLALFAGLIAGGGLFWAYNRGVIGAAIVPLYAVVSLWSGRGWKCSFAPVAGLIAGSAIAALIEPSMYFQHVANIIYWLRNSSIWHYPFRITRLIFNIPFYGISAIAIILGLRRLWASRHRSEFPAQPAATAILIAITGMIVQQIQNRDDNIHVTFATPWIFLLLIHLYNSSLARSGPENLGWAKAIRRHIVFISIVSGMVLVDFYSESSVIRSIILGSAENIIVMKRGIPRDVALISPENQAIVRELRSSDDKCTYVSNNAGAIYHLSNLIPCSNIMYPIYASRKLEGAVISDLARSRPALIVGYSDDWFSTIDHKPMQYRMPLLAAWIKEEYPIISYHGKTEIRRHR